MIPLPIVVLVEEHTPAYWIQGVIASLHSSLKAPFSIDVRVVPPVGLHSPIPGAPVLSIMANSLLSIDRWLRSIARFADRLNRRKQSPASRTESVPFSASLSAPSATRRLGKAESIVAPGEMAISLLRATRTLLQSGKLDGCNVLWAECDETVLGSSAFGFLSALASRAATVDVVVNGALPALPHRTLVWSRSAVRSVSPSFNDEMLAARVTDLLGLCLETLRTDQFDNTVPVATMPQSTDSARDRLDASSLLRLSNRRLFTAQFGKRRRLRWTLAYRRTIGESVDASFTSVPQSELIMPPPGHAWADPFPVRTEGRDLIFFEQEVVAEGRGHIAVAELHADGTLGPVTRVLETSFHMSYPCVFQAYGSWFMVPESRADQRVTLYRAADFPFRWEKERDLLIGPRLADATLFHRDGMWWMLACRIGAGASTFEDLVGYRATDLLGTWTAIRELPLSSDATAGRPAGHLLQTPQGLLRPAQDGSHRYGYGLALRQVTQLTAQSYSECEYARVTPTWLPELRGVHTFNRSSHLTVVDILQALY
jgi:hypothetical protein